MHPLERVDPLTLEALAEYPIVTYHEGFTGRAASTRPLPVPASTPTS